MILNDNSINLYLLSTLKVLVLMKTYELTIEYYLIISLYKD